MRQNCVISYLSLTKTTYCVLCLAHSFCAICVNCTCRKLCWLHKLCKCTAQKIAQLHKLCMLIFQKLAVAQALCIYSPKISTVWEEEKNRTSMLEVLVAFCISARNIRKLEMRPKKRSSPNFVWEIRKVQLY